MLKKLMNMMGWTPASMAQQLGQFGDVNEIQRAIENGDKKSLSFVEKAAMNIKQNNPQLYNQVEAMFRQRFNS